jgi:hypothetical protein
MYCERCGKQLDEALNFCNGCGAQLRNAGESGQKSVLHTLVVALIVVATTGIGMLAVLIPILLDRVTRFEPVMAFAIFYMAMLFGVCYMIMRPIMKLVDAKIAGKNIYDPAPATKQPLVQLPSKTTAQLEAQREPASVVDVTTRTLEEVPLRRN